MAPGVGHQPALRRGRDKRPAAAAHGSGHVHRRADLLGEKHEHVEAGIQDRPREFFAFLFILASGVFGVFASLDLFMLFFFYEIAYSDVPPDSHLGLGGDAGVRCDEANAVFVPWLRRFPGRGPRHVLAGAQTLGFYTFDMLVLETARFSPAFQNLWFLPVFFGFAVLGGIWPFHNWSPDGHVAAPTAVSMFHAGVLMKLGAFAALRVGIMLLPEGAKTWSWLIMLCAAIGVVYGAYIAFVQSDFKYVIGFSSVSHMGLVMLGISTLSREGLTGAGVQMFSHGVMTALFFAVVGMVYDRAHTREIPELGGMVRFMPWPAVGFIIGSLVSMGMPGFSGFIAEFPIFLGYGKPSGLWQ